MKICNAIPLLFCGLLTACGSKEKTVSQKTPKTPLPFDQSTFNDVTPMADGSAYLRSLKSSLWYLRGNKAIRVTVLDNTSLKIPAFSDITPALDGTAYALSADGNDGLWHLHENYAEKVNEVDFLPQAESHNKVSDKALFALYISERKKRKEAEVRADNPSEDDAPEYDNDPY